MKTGQRFSQAFSDYAAGRLMTPRAIYSAFFSELAQQDQAQVFKRFFQTPADNPAQFDAPERLRAPSLFRSGAWHSQGERADWQHCDQRLMRWAAMVVEYGRKRDIPLYVHTAFRGRALQDELKAKGNSNASAGRSPHQIGEAVDIVHSVYHWDMTRTEWQFLYKLGDLAFRRLNAELPKERQLALTWGGEFKSLYDPAHWEITDFRQRLRPVIERDPVHKMPAAILRDIRF